MTSPVDTSVKFFTSQMVGAPVLSGTAGAMIGLLDACLKDGFDTKTLVSLVVASGVATATWSGTHSAAVDSVVLIAGVTGALTALNGEQKVVTKPGSTSITFATAAADGTAAGTITMKMAPIGWTKPFTGTNKGCYKSSDVTSTGCLLRVDDAGTTTCRVVGYVSMTDVDTGLEPFPNNTQMSGGGYWAKSSVASAAASQWVLYGDSKMFYLFNAPGYAGNNLQYAGISRCFGDPIAFKPSGDNYCCTLSYSITATVTSEYDGGVDSVGNTAQFATPRNHTGLGSAVLYVKIPAGGVSIALSGTDSTLGAFPSGQVDGALRLVKVELRITASGVGPRAEFPGVYHALHTVVFDTFKTFDSVPGSGSLVGRNVMALTNTNTSFNTNPTNAMGAAFFDKTGPWR